MIENHLNTLYMIRVPIQKVPKLYMNKAVTGCKSFGIKKCQTKYVKSREF